MKSARLLLIVACALSGCAAPKFLSKTKDVAPMRGERRDEAMRQFEVHRDNAEYQAAMERWTSGDPFTCEAQLRGLVTRNPKHLAGRQALADLAMERGDGEAAEQQLRDLLKIAPDDPQTHHSLGLLLAARDQTDEARQHLSRAAELAPDNTLYQLCMQHDPTPSPAETVAQR
jgi:Flp pilus assembly protein TadD